MSGSDPLAAALRLLSLRDRSASELARRLHRQGFATEQIEATVARCRELGYLDDDRFAQSRAQALTRQGRAVGRRLLLELRRSGLDASTAARAAAEAQRECPVAEALAELRRRRFPDFAWSAADDRERKRVVDYFQRRGFPLSLVLSFFQEER